METRYAHTNIIAKDWKALSRFYRNVFGLTPVPPERDIKGVWFDRLTGIENAHITGEHLALPGFGGNPPTLEIFSYDTMEPPGEKRINREGLGHLAFEVQNVSETLAKIISEGGGQVGETVSADYPGGVKGYFVYATDPEGNIIELQSWEGAKTH